MTVVAGITNGHTAWLGADTGARDNGGLRWPSAKLHRIPAGPETALLAFAGNGRLRGVVSQLTIEAPAADCDMDTWARGIARSLTGIAVDTKPPVVDDNGLVDGHGLLAFRGRLWHLWQDMADPVQRCVAIGSGGDLAIGALEALLDRQPDREALTRALEITCDRHGDCDLPFDLDCT